MLKYILFVFIFYSYTPYVKHGYHISLSMSEIFQPATLIPLHLGQCNTFVSNLIQIIQKKIIRKKNKLPQNILLMGPEDFP